MSLCAPTGTGCPVPATTSNRSRRKRVREPVRIHLADPSHDPLASENHVHVVVARRMFAFRVMKDNPQLVPASCIAGLKAACAAAACSES